MDVAARDQDQAEGKSSASKQVNGHTAAPAVPPRADATRAAADQGPAAAPGRPAAAAALKKHVALSSPNKPVASSGGAALYVALAAATLAFAASCALTGLPDDHQSSLAAALRDWSPLPQAGLLCVVIMLAAAVILQRRRRPAASRAGLPAGVCVDASGVLCSDDGVPLARGFRLVGASIIANASGSALPPTLQLGPGGVLLHTPSGRPVPHSCSLGPHGGLLSSDGRPLPDSMGVGPNCCLMAADGTVLSPDLQPVPEGFTLSKCGGKLLRPNGKPVPRGVHVGPGFRLTKPTGDLMPDGVKIGPAGTIICVDGTILASDGAPVRGGFVLSADKTQILHPDGSPLQDGCEMGPNCTLISREGRLETALGKLPLGPAFSLGPLGNLLLQGRPVATTAAFDAHGQLVAADGTVLHTLA